VSSSSARAAAGPACSLWEQGRRHQLSPQCKFGDHVEGRLAVPSPTTADNFCLMMSERSSEARHDNAEPTHPAPRDSRCFRASQLSSPSLCCVCPRQSQVHIERTAVTLQVVRWRRLALLFLLGTSG
jgi:hypothetical protein